MITKEYVRKHKFDGELKPDDKVYLSYKNREVVKGQVYSYYHHWNGRVATIKLENGDYRHVRTRDSGCWGAMDKVGFLMREKDISWKDLIEESLK